MMIHRRPKLLWPEYSIAGGRRSLCQLDTVENCGLRPLKCAGWDLIQNPEFNYLTLKLKPNTERTAERWYEQFCYLGQDKDVVVKTRNYDVRLHRPICTDMDKFKICFHYLVGPHEPVYF